MSVNIIEPSAERVERAARALATRENKCRDWRTCIAGRRTVRDNPCGCYFDSRAALAADAQALIGAIIDELRVVRDISRETEWVETIEAMTSDRITELQADLDKERGNG